MSLQNFSYDPDSERWEGVAGTVTDALVSVNPMLLAKWASSLQPVRASLLPYLAAVYRNRDGKHSETEQTLATNILEDYAADQPETLADLVMDAEPKQFVILYPKLAEHKDRAVALLRGEIDRELKPNWRDADLDPSWTTPDASLVRGVESADGLVEERFALCQTMPLGDFAQVAESLRASGYRPMRCRPYALGDSVQVSAVWTRDGREWQLTHGLSAEDIRRRDEDLRTGGFMPVDVAGYVAGENGKPAEHYAAVWVKRATDEEDARMYVAVSDAEHKTIYGAIEKEGFAVEQSLQAFRGVDGQQKYCGVKLKSDDESTLTWNKIPSMYEGMEYLDKTQWDIDVGNAAQTQTTEERYTEALAEAEEKLKSKPDDLSARYARAVANYHLGSDGQALEDFDFLIEKDPKLSSRYQYRAVLHARMGEEDAAKKDLATFDELSQSESTKAYLDAVVAAYLGEDDEGMKRLEAGVQEHSGDTGFLYDAACAYSIASKVTAEDDPAKSKLYANRAVALLKEAIANGYDVYSHMQTDPDLDPIHDQPGFQQLLSKGHLDRRCAAVWNVSTDYKSVDFHGLSPKDHITRCQELIAQGYRPVAISVAAIGEEHTVVTASVWHQPLVSEDEEEALGKRQANAAVALLRMGQEEEVWPLLKHNPDPRVRSWVIHRLSPMEAAPEVIVNRLAEESEVSIRRALILSLGEYDDLPPADREALIGTLLDMYRDDPDPGIHGAAEWLLRKWNQQEKLKEIDEKLATGRVEGDRQWYINGQGHTMVVISGPVEFAMGSPASEPDRRSLERLHRRRIGRTFAIAAKEVTVRQFHEFLRANPSVRHGYTERYAPEPNCPQTGVIWYEAAAYCRWLSQKERVPEDQMCYPPIPEIKERMILPKDYLQRTGYRLPTEAEWEYTCRCGALTSRYYGQSEDLLGKYAWYIDTANDRSWPVASLKPNDWGLFDMHGNVWEWCQERYSSYSPTQGGKPTEDTEDTQLVQDKNSRVLRGGSFLYLPWSLRSAYRFGYQPSIRLNAIGFRPARTYP